MHPWVGGYALVGSYTAMTRQDWLVMAISRKSILVVPNVRFSPVRIALALNDLGVQLAPLEWT